MAIDIVVIGASAGGVEAMTKLASLLPGKLPVSLFLTIHTGAGGQGWLAEILSRAGTFQAIYALDHEAIRQQCIYIAAPDRHLVLQSDHVVCFYGPKENRFRPSIDVMFRSAAEIFGPRVVGVILTGMLDDGSEGLLTIRERGGTAIVQDPAEAMYPDMPSNAIRYAGADYVRPLADIPSLLVELTAGREPGGVAVVQGNRKQEPKPTSLTCPECGGPLSQDRDGIFSHFRCRVGHAYSLRTLKEAQETRVEAGIWAAMQAIEESSEIARRLAKEVRNRGDETEATLYDRTVEASMRRAKALREMLEKGR